MNLVQSREVKRSALTSDSNSKSQETNAHCPHHPQPAGHRDGSEGALAPSYAKQRARNGGSHNVTVSVLRLCNFISPLANFINPCYTHFPAGPPDALLLSGLPMRDTHPSGHRGVCGAETGLLEAGGSQSL